MARKKPLKGFKKPKGYTFEHNTVEPNYGKFIAYRLREALEHTNCNYLAPCPSVFDPGYGSHRRQVTCFNEEGVPHLVSSEYEALRPASARISRYHRRTVKKLQIRMPEDSEGTNLLIECKGAGSRPLARISNVIRWR
jgi:DNA-directed RNA polymerase subunit alpha